MSQQNDIQDRIRKHKIAAIVMGTCIVILIIVHAWQEGIGNLVATVHQRLK